MQLAATRGPLEWLGSGFFVSDWEDGVVTAAHVVYRPGGKRATQVELSIWLGDTWWQAFAAAVAVDLGSDVAVLVCGQSRPALEHDMALDGTMHESFSAEVCGFGAREPDRTRPFHRLATVGTASEALISYAPPVGRDGMSGGPVVVADKTPVRVRGVHRGSPSAAIPRVAARVNPERLEELRSEALRRVGR
ncbi:MAG: trypsin-like peptidase domain-containing protein [Polyangiaceae bacterium]|nr:trypsin-like peptidase domain-containing protein [Polyangiaceae bacterium]